jgi:hypothetical protein
MWLSVSHVQAIIFMMCTSETFIICNTISLILLGILLLTMGPGWQLLKDRKTVRSAPIIYKLI